MPELTEAEYAAGIPKCCAYQTMQQHMEDLLGCWGLISSLENNTPMDCGYCDLNTAVTDEERREHYAKLKTWDIISA